MGAGVIGLAMSLLCAWSAPHCDRARQVQVVYGPTYGGGMSWWDARKGVISISDDYRQPELVAALLAHETQNALGVWKGLANCEENETAAGRAEWAEYQWFVGTFGAVDASTLSPAEARYVGSLPS